MDDKEQEHAQDYVDGEVVAEFDDQTLMNLPTVADGQTQPDEGQRVADSARRQFMTRLTIGGVAALALGGSAALLVSQRNREPTVVVLPNGSELGLDPQTADATTLIERIAELEYQLASVTAERDQLLSVLNAEGGEYEALLAELEAMRGELDNERRINSLWEAMDAIGLDAVLTSGLALIGGALDTFVDIMGVLRTGVAKGETALTNFIRLLPGPSDGIAWLSGRVSRMADDLDWLDEQVQEVVENASQFAAKITEFILWVLDRLPFGAGERARAGMDAMEVLITGLPDLVDGVTADVLDPLATWFDEQAEGSVFDLLLDPVETHLVTPSRNTLASFTAFKNVYDERLIAPVQLVLEERAAIRTQVEELQVLRGLRA